jgi:hypothetical protein
LISSRDDVRSRLEVDRIGERTSAEKLIVDHNRRSGLVDRKPYGSNMDRSLREKAPRSVDGFVIFADLDRCLAYAPSKVLGCVAVLAELQLSGAEVHRDIPALDERPRGGERRARGAVIATLARLHRFVKEVTRAISIRGFAEGRLPVYHPRADDKEGKQES